MTTDGSMMHWRRSLHGLIVTGVVAALAVLTAIFAFARLSDIFRYLAKSYNEGWYALHVDSVLKGLPLYPPRGGLLTNNYPPLWFYLTAEVSRWTGDIIFAGRIVTALSFGFVGLCIGILVKRITGDVSASIMAALVYFLTMLTNYPYSVAFGDPQMLAHAVIMGALVWYSYNGRSVWRIWLLAFLMTTAMFIKHNPISLPLATGIALLAHNRRTGLHYVLAGAVMALIGLLLCLALFGHAFIDGLISARRYGVRGIVELFSSHLMPQLPLLALGCLGIAVRDRDEWRTLIVSYILLSIGIGMFWSGGSGVGGNIFVDVAIGCAIAAGLLVAHANQGWRKSGCNIRVWAVCAVAVTALCTPGMLYARSMLNIPGWMAHEAALDASTRTIVATIRDYPGRILCEMPSLCYWSGKAIEVDPFNRLEAVLAGRTDRHLLERMIERKEFALILVTRDWPKTLYFPDVLGTIQANYRPINAGDDPAFILLAPRSGGMCPPDTQGCAARPDPTSAGDSDPADRASP